QNELERQAFFDDLVEDIDELQSVFEANEAQRKLAESERALNEEERELNEQGRVSAESVRVSNEAERISKDSERDGKIEAVEGNLESKANRQQENMISPTYLNGWGGNIGYYKDEFGVVHLEG